MSKFVEVLEETQEMFNEVLDNTSIPQWVEFKLLANNNQNELYTVKKMSELFEVLTDNLNVVIVLNEEVFDQLDDPQKLLVFEEALTGVAVNENDKISLEKFDFTTYGGMLSKHGDETMIRLKESIIAVFQQKKEKEDAVKQAKKKKNEE
ncbi:MAG: hypothetical protein PF487_09345 [Bacteroidales bacterium]|jgi:hypothetical protein|nr:hypothetical protein [Bacteroidales bacterium]